MRLEYTCVLDMCLPPKKDIRTSEETTNLIMHDVFRHHSLPDNIDDHNLYLNFGNISSQCSKSFANSPQVIIHKLMAKQSVQIKH